MTPTIPLRAQRFAFRRDMPRLGVRREGFTLIEMLVVMVIVGVLAALVAPSMRALILNQGIKTASFDLFSALEYARSEAIKRNGSINLKAGPKTNDTWTTGWRVEDASSNVLRSWTVASNLAVTEAGSAASITFGMDGHMTAPATAPKLQIVSTATVDGVTSRCIQVDLVGRARTQTGTCS